ncbi:MAG: DUF1499 domain-containing protein [Candidatus Thalassarchaeaceae archaeon]|jgi:uncharacterized protein (DUF1499 family)|nr:DUF1499 domain-containing protein [Candidatus Thalassarchaeaceae archaeon]
MEQRRWILIPPAIWIACIMIIQILGAFTAPSSSEMPEECPEGSQNCARVMMGIEGTPEEVHTAAMNWVDSQGRTEIEAQSETTSHTVFRTPWMLYPDDFFIQTGCTENGTWIQVHSESRLGIGDMGVNQERIDALLDHMVTVELETSDC